MTHRVLIVDDEPLARQRVRDLLAPHDDFSVVADFASGEAAVVAVSREAPDVLFVDIQLPEFDGLQVAEAVVSTYEEGSPVPFIVFVTAHDRYALRAFDAAAVDYLLKPVGQPRFDRTLSRLRALLAGRQAELVVHHDDGAAAIGRVLQQFERRRLTAQRIAVRHRDRVVFIATTDIDWIDAAGNYMRVHVSGTTYMVRSTMAALEARLDPERFVRMHRSAIVNLERIVNVWPSEHGDFIVTLTDGSRLTTSRSYSRRLRSSIRALGGTR
jgi:two-component system LytT family response regulator